MQLLKILALREIYQRHIDRVQEYMTEDATSYGTPTSSKKKQKK